VVTRADGDARGGLQAGGVDDRHATLRAFVRAHPEVLLVRLQGEAHGARAGGNIGDDFPGAGVHDGDLARVGHADEEPLLIPRDDPVRAGALEPDERDETAAAEAEQRVDDRDARLLVERQQVVAVEVHVGAGAQAALEEGLDLLAAELRVGGRALAPRQPDRGLDPGQRRPGRRVGDAEADARVLSLHQRRRPFVAGR
jgi:hypothetical protein